MRVLFLILATFSIAPFIRPVLAGEVGICQNPWSSDDSPREQVLEQCRQTGSMPDGTPILDREECLVVYRKGGRYSVEYLGRVLGSGYVLMPEFRGNTNNPDETVIVGKFGGGWTEMIAAGRSIGSYDLNQILDLGRGRFVYSRDFRHVAFVEHRPDGSWWLNVDGKATRLRGPVEVVNDFLFDPSGSQVALVYLSPDGKTHQQTFFSPSPPIIVR